MEVMSNWAVKKLTDLGELARGKSKHRPRDASHLYGGIYPFIQTGDIKAANHKVFSYSQTYSEAGLAQSRLWPKGTVCITIAANIADSAMLNFPACFPDSVLGFIPNEEKCDGEFIEYLLQYYQKEIKTHSIGSVQENINLGTFDKVFFNIPPLTNQKAIAEILSSLDDKIELNNHINQNLEALAQAIFKQWFVDFEFPNENGEPYKSSGGEMVDSELGEIPKGWEVKSLDEIAEYLNGLALQKFRPKNENDPSLPVIKIKELRQGYANGEEKASMEIDKKYKIQDGDILFSWSGSLLVDFWTGGEGALNQHLFKVSSKTYSKWFIFLWTKFHLQEFQKIAEGKATTMGHIQRKHLSDARVLVPPRDLLEKFTETFENIIEEIISSRLESRKLMNLRDTLLPKLISGELEVNQIEKEVYG